jgi:hypothetical protein
MVQLVFNIDAEPAADEDFRVLLGSWAMMNQF